MTERNEQVHPMFRELLNGLTIPKRITCHHPSLQVNDDGICCDCGAQATTYLPRVTFSRFEGCPEHPDARVNDFGGAYVLCATCSRQILKGRR